VDPKTVTITKKVDPSAVGLPTPVSDLQPGAYNYLAKVELGPQQITIAITTTIQEENGVWLVTNEQSSPMGVATETLRVEKGTLIPLKRSLSQAQMSLSLEYAGGNVTGSMNMNGQANPISVDAGGPLFPEATSLPQAFAALPLAEGYTTMFRNFDAMTQKAKLLQLKVAAAESVTVAAGTFQAHKVEITSAEGGPERATIWITQDTRQPVKLETVLVAAGGAQLTSELQ